MDKAQKHSQIPPPINSTIHHPIRSYVKLVMPFTNQSLKRIVSLTPIKSNHQKLFCIKNITMADQENKGTQTLNVETANKIQNKTETPSDSIPPPPEKPLPDDCCGSGCVRCVWDMYYDELEDYNKLYGSQKSGAKTQ